MAAEVSDFVRRLYEARKPWRMTIIELNNLYRHFFRRLVEENRDPKDVEDALYDLDTSLTYDEARRELEEKLRISWESPEEMARELTLTELERERDRIVEEMRRLGVKPPEDRVAELEAKVAGLRDALRRTELLAKEVEDLKEALRKREIEAAEYRRRIEELRREIEEARKVPWERVLVPPARPKPAPPVPVPAPPVARPPARVLPPMPETCPVCGAPLKEVTRVPLIVKDPVLTPEEEYLRARLGLPLPTARMEWIDVPVTMKVWQCEGPETHFFERDEAGRLVQRTPEALYRKILTETARLRRITYPPAVPPAYVAAPPPRRITLQDTFRSWLQTVKGMTMNDYMRLTETERSALNREFAEWYRRAAGY